MATMQDYNEYTKEAINGIYDAQREKQLADLETAYNTNLATAEAAKGQIGNAYQEQRNNLANTYERTRKNTNEAAAASGLNAGTGSQAALMQRSEYQRDNAKIGTAEANAMAQAEQGITDLKTKYQGAVAAANADNDYQRSVALLNQYKAEYDQQLSRAQTLAQYGDFTGYAAVYGQEQADNMRKAWIATNPDVAYNTGNISAEEYRAVTGVYPKGYTAPGTGGYSGYGGGYNYDNASGLTTSEIKQLQKAMGVSADGVWGPKTEAAWSALSAQQPNNTTPGGTGNTPPKFGIYGATPAIR